MNRSVTNVTCFEWSVMNRSALKGHHDFRRPVATYMLKLISSSRDSSACPSIIATLPKKAREPRLKTTDLQGIKFLKDLSLSCWQQYQNSTVFIVSKIQ